MTTASNAARDVLVLDADQPSALAIVRALGRHGLRVEVAASQDAPIAGWSRHAAACHRHPDPLRAPDGFLHWLRQQMERPTVGLVIPVTERTVVPISRHRESLDVGRIAIAPSAALEQALDKQRTMALAVELGIPVPRSVPVSRLDELPEAAATLGYPIVVKPTRSMGQDGAQGLQLSVRYAHHADELQGLVREALRYGQVMLQELFRGEGVGIELIADQGRLCHVFQHRRLHEVPLTGGGSSLRVSAPVVPALRDAAAKLMQATSWHGVAMVEFKHNPATGDFRLMEINGRFWGSLPLAVAAGANFPVMLHELMTKGRVGAHPPSRDGVLCRQLARDIDWLEHVLRRAAPAALVRLPTWREVLRDSLLVLSPRHHFDVQSWSDPKPGFVDLARIGQHQWQRVSGMLRQRRQLAAARRSAAPGGASRRALTPGRKVLFLCHGNINRSALAHAYAARRHGASFGFSSAGFHAPGGRPADPVMVDVAAAQGIDLSGWSSQVLSADLVAGADVILAMELVHLQRLLTLHPQVRHKAFLLGAAKATGLHDVEVPDPYGQARPVYERVCRQVLAAVDAWLPAGRCAGQATGHTTDHGTSPIAERSTP